MAQGGLGAVYADFRVSIIGGLRLIERIGDHIAIVVVILVHGVQRRAAIACDDLCSAGERIERRILVPVKVEFKRANVIMRMPGKNDVTAALIQRYAPGGVEGAFVHLGPEIKDRWMPDREQPVLRIILNGLLKHGVLRTGQGLVGIQNDEAGVLVIKSKKRAVVAKLAVLARQVSVPVGQPGRHGNLIVIPRHGHILWGNRALASATQGLITGLLPNIPLGRLRAVLNHVAHADDEAVVGRVGLDGVEYAAVSCIVRARVPVYHEFPGGRGLGLCAC